MSCHAQIVKRKALLWGGAVFLLSFRMVLLFSSPFRMVLRFSFRIGWYISLLPWSGAALLIIFLWSGASFELPAFGRCCFSSSSFWVVMSSTHLFGVVLRCLPPSGWCCFHRLLLGGSDFLSFIKCFLTMDIYSNKIKNCSKKT